MMETLQVENKIVISPQLLKNTSRHKAPKSFYEKSLLIENYYTFVEDDVNNEQKIIGLILFHDLTDFLLWVQQPIVAIFGNIEKTLHLSKCWDEDEFHLVLTICSGLEDMDELNCLEDKLFDILENYHGITHALHYIVIAQD
jgi:hypothetical protein